MSQDTLPADPLASRNQRNAVVIAALALLAGLVVTGLGVFWVQLNIQHDIQERFSRHVDRIQADVQNRLNAPLLGLRGAAGVYASSESVTRDEFRMYVASSELTNDFPGVRGFGFIARVMRADLASFVAAERADGAPEFSIAEVGGGDADLYVVKFVEPLSRNREALGLDLGSDAIRRDAIEQAIDGGMPTLSRKIVLAQDQQQRPGFLYLLPIYRQGNALDTVAERRAASLGLVYSPMVVSEIMRGAADVAEGWADFDLIDGAGASDELLYQQGRTSANGQRPDASRLVSASRPVAAGGRSLTLHARSTAGFEAASARVLPALLGAGGAMISLLLALFIWTLGSGRARALSLAQRVTVSLALERQRLISIVEGTNVGTWEWDVLNGENRFDERGAAIMGYSLEEMQAAGIQIWRDRTHPEDLARSDALIRKHLAGDSPYYDCDIRFRHHDGHWVWVHLRARVSLRGADGRAHKMAGTMMDITARQTVAQVLRNSEEQFRRLFETSLDAMLQLRPDGRVLNANPAACALFGMGVEELRRRGRRGLVDPSDDRLKRLLEAREAGVRGELRMLRADGAAFECELSASMFVDSGNQTYINVVMRDISDRKRSEMRINRLNAELERRVQRRTAELDASNRDLQAFAHSVAHDLRQPFIAIGGFSGLLERTLGEGGDQRARHYINRIKAGVRQAGEMTEALLTLANLSRVPLRAQRVDLGVVAQAAMDKLRLQQGFTRVVAVTIQGGLVAQADPVLCRLLMEELLGNAWKFTSRKKHAEISFGLRDGAWAAEGDAVYVVKDNGEGFDMAHADKLFDSFQRLHSSQEFSGVGIGLANIRRIVARHGGKIWAESTPGQGASFYFTLGGTVAVGLGDVEARGPAGL